MSQKQNEAFIDSHGFGRSRYFETKRDFVLEDETTREVVDLFYEDEDKTHSEYGIVDEIDSSGSNLQKELEMLDGNTRLEFLVDEGFLDREIRDHNSATGYVKQYQFGGLPDYMEESDL
ncbi:MAG: hypothetical protein H8Z69_03260 [Nanohaloarchaea archaeon]|nr:hypothetical protein [Candidatus Nanohaloarchaea archaeon]